jgi:hypothetical protein
MKNMLGPLPGRINLEKLEADFSAARGLPVSPAEVRAYLEENKITRRGDGCWQIDGNALDLLHPSEMAE